MSGTKQNPEIKKEEAERRSKSIFCDRASFFVSHSRASPRDAIPSAFRLPRRCAPRNDTKIGTFLLATQGFILESVKKLEELFIAPTARQILHETAQRACARCECA